MLRPSLRAGTTIETAPAVAAGIIPEPWSLAQLVEEALAAEEAPPIKAEPLRPREGDHRTARELPEGRGWLRVIDGGRTRPAVGPKPAVKPAVAKPAEGKQLDLLAWKPKTRPEAWEQLKLFDD